MWERVELKNKAKQTLNLNYWIFVLAAVVLLFLGSNGFDLANLKITDNGNFVDQEIPSGIYDGATYIMQGGLIQGLFASFFAGIAILIAFSSIAVKIFISGPIGVGVCNTFYKGQYGKVEAKEIFSAFTGGAYLNVVLVQFLRGLFTALWTLLFIIPGIVKAYEYRMIPYLLAENQSMDRKDAFAVSKQMMTGEKMNAFILDLSFILWKLLSAITFGIVGVFYVNPYVESTCAQLYITLKEKDNQNFDREDI